VQRVEQRLLRRRQIRRLEKQVVAGEEGPDRGLRGRPALRRRHVQRVGHHHTLETQVGMQQVDQDLRGERRGGTRIDRLHVQVPGHHQVRPGLDTTRERRQVAGLETGQALAEDRHAGVAVHGRVAVSWKVLEGRGHPGGVQTAYRGGDLDPDRGRVGPVRAGADHRAAGRTEDVGVRGEVGVEAQCREVRPGGRPALLGQLRVGRRPERHGRGQLGHPGADPGDPAVLLVDADQERYPGGQPRRRALQPGRQRMYLDRVVDVRGRVGGRAAIRGRVVDQYQPAEPVLRDHLGRRVHPGQLPVRLRRPVGDLVGVQPVRVRHEYLPDQVHIGQAGRDLGGVGVRSQRWRLLPGRRRAGATRQ